MFKLVGPDYFTIGSAQCKVNVSPIGSFSYQYTLEVNGKSYKAFTEHQSKVLRTWTIPHHGVGMCRVVLERDTLDVWVNGNKVEVASEFVDDGTEMHFNIEDISAYIKACSSGNRREGIIHSLIINDEIIPESVE